VLYHSWPTYESTNVKRLLILLGAAAIVLAACSGAAPAIVNGIPITEAELEGMSSGGAVPEGQLQGDLFDLVSTAIAEDGADADFGFTITEEARTAELEAIEAAVTEQGTTVQQILDDRARTDSWVDLIIKQTILSRDVSAELVAEQGPITDDEVREAFDAQLPQLIEVCARHILLENEADAALALVRAEAGEDFGDLAIELSTGPSGPTGGDLGCAPPGNYVPEFAEAIMNAEVEVPSGPVESEFGWHVILVESRDEPSFEDSELIVRESLEISRGNELYTAWIIERMRAADVTISDAYGTWTVPDDETLAPSIVPPTP